MRRSRSKRTPVPAIRTCKCEEPVKIRETGDKNRLGDLNLNDEFDALLARSQTAKARAAMKAAFSASPKLLGKAAVAAARKRT
jgi:hypothetical protein